MLSSLFTAVSVYASSITTNQIIAFILAIILNSLFYFGFDLISEISFIQAYDLFIKKIGIAHHYKMMSKGLIRLDDFIYFISISFLFIKITEYRITSKKA